MHVVKAAAELSKYGNSLAQGERSLAESFPGRYVVWSFAAELEEAVLHLVGVQISQGPSQVENVGMVELAKPLCDLSG